MAFKILVADDESNITDVCRRYLELEGFEVLTAGDGEEALEKFHRESPHLVVLDLMMPKLDGWSVCNEIRSRQDTPIIMLTAKAEERDRLAGLTMGADDYLTKPFSPRELVLRVKAVLRRVGNHQSSGDVKNGKEPIRCGALEINPAHRSVRIAGREIELTIKEFDLLLLLVTHPEQVFSRNQLLNRIWEIDYYGDTTTVTVHIRRLREKIEDNPSQPRYIKTVWGIGYKFEGRDVP